MQLYRDGLSREPDKKGMDHYAQQLLSGRSMDDIRHEIMHSPEAKERGVGAYTPSEEAPAPEQQTTPTAVEEIKKIYREELGRDPDPEGMQNYVDHINSGKGLDWIRNDIKGSPEAKQLRGETQPDADQAQLDEIRKIYNEELGREPDPEGQQNYLAQLGDGRSLKEIRDEIADSPEAKERGVGNHSPEAKIAGIYNDELGRDPDPKGLQNYIDHLNKGVTLDQIRKEIRNSPEAKERGVGAFSPKSQITKFYKEQLERDPDAKGLEHYLQQHREGKSLEEIMKEISESPEAKERGVGAYDPIAKLYRETLGREPDPKGLAHYRKQVEGGRSLDEIRDEMFKSPEAKDRGIGHYAPGQPGFEEPGAGAGGPSKYQGQIDDILGQIGGFKGQYDDRFDQFGNDLTGMKTSFDDAIGGLRNDITGMGGDFDAKLKGIMDANAKNIEELTTSYELGLDKFSNQWNQLIEGQNAAYRDRMKQQRRQSERARRERDITERTARENNARASAAKPEFMLGTTGMRGTFMGGIGGFKRGGNFNSQAAKGLSIAQGTKGKNKNKMLNL